MNDYQFGNFIFERRGKIGMTQAEMAERLGVTNKAVKLNFPTKPQASVFRRRSR